MAGSIMVALSGAVPPVINEALAGTATIDLDVDIVTAVTLANTNGLDFGRIAITNGGPATGNHTLSPAGAVNAATNTSVVVAGTPGNFDITGGTSASDVSITLGAAVLYNAGNISINRLTFSGPGLTGTVAVAAGGNATHNFAGGNATAVNVGGRMALSGPAVGSYTGSSIVVTIVDIP